MNEKLQTNTSRVASIFRNSFLDGFTMAGLFGGLRPPNSPTQMFAPELSPEADDQKRTEEVVAAAKKPFDTISERRRGSRKGRIASEAVVSHRNEREAAIQPMAKESMVKTSPRVESRHPEPSQLTGFDRSEDDDGSQTSH